MENRFDHLINSWKTIRTKYMDAIILIRSENLYLTFGSNAETLKQILSVETTQYKDGLLQCSFPFSELDSAISKLVKEGHRVAVCEST